MSVALLIHVKSPLPMDVPGLLDIGRVDLKVQTCFNWLKYCLYGEKDQSINTD